MGINTPCIKMLLTLVFSYQTPRIFQLRMEGVDQTQAPLLAKSVTAPLPALTNGYFKCHANRDRDEMLYIQRNLGTKEHIFYWRSYASYVRESEAIVPTCLLCQDNALSTCNGLNVLDLTHYDSLMFVHFFVNRISLLNQGVIICLLLPGFEAQQCSFI